MRDRKRRATQVQAEAAKDRCERGASLVRLILLTVLPAVLAVALAMPGVASAESLCTDTWVGPVEGTWGTAADWSLGTVPSSTDVACIGTGKTVEVTESGAHAAVVQGEGSLVIQGSSVLELASALEVSVIHSFTVSGNGTLTGAGTLDISGSLSWTSAESIRMAGTGSIVLLSGGSGSISLPTSRSTVWFEGRPFVNEGTVTFTQGRFQMSAGANLVNSGTFYANTESSEARFLYYPKVTPEPKVVNSGVFDKAEGGGTTLIEMAVENSGTVKAQTGIFSLSAGGAGSSGTWAGSGGTIRFGTGSFTLTGGTWLGSVNVGYGSNVTVSGVSAGGAQVSLPEVGRLAVQSGTMSVENLSLEGGRLEGAGSISISNLFSWTRGETVYGPGAIVLQPTASGTIKVGSVYVRGRSLVNEGTLTFEEGRLELSEGADVKNSGTFNANSQSYESEKQLSFYPKEGEAPKIVNTGTFQKTAGTGRTTVEPTFENYGILKTGTGSLVIEHPVEPETESQYGSLNASALASLKALCGDPIDCVTGNYTETQTDLSVGGRGVGLRLERTYNVQAAAKAAGAGSFGYGWTSSFSDHLLVESTNHKATLYQANGSTVPFTEAAGAFTAPKWSADTLAGNTEAGYTVTLANQTKYVFSGSNGRLESIEDRNGNKTVLSYNEAGQLVTITDPAGRTIKLAYNAEGHVESATDPMGHVVKYAYEGGNLVSVTLPGETNPNWRYKYDASHRMTVMINALGGETTNTYDGSNRVISQKDPLGHILRFEYGTFQTKITNEATGAVTLDQYTSAGTIVAITHGYGTSSATTTKITYNEANEPAAVTDGDGHTTTYEYDSAGNKIKMVDPEGRETKWTYNSTHDITSMTRPNGEKTTITLDEHGNPTLISRPAPGNTTQETKLEYDTHGQLTSMTNPLGRKWSYEYDNQGDRTSETDPEGDKRTWAYNEDSKQTSTVSPRGNITGGEPAKYTTTTERDAQGRAVKVTDPLGHITRFSYDPDSNRTSVIDPNGRETKTEYNLANEPVKVTLPNGATRETGYDAAGQITTQTDGNKHTTTYTRNVLEQITEITDPLLHKTTKTYDATGNLASITDPAKRTTSFTYNKDNQPVKITYSDGVTPTVEYEYDKDGNRTSMTDGSGKTTYTHDQLDRLTKVTDGHGDTVSYEYDLANEQTKITYPNGKTVEHTYDKADRLSTLKDWLGNTTSFGYDPNSNLTSITLPTETGETDHYAYNEADQQTETKMSKGEETLGSLAYTRDNNGQITKTVSKGLPGAETIESSYDENERLSKAGGTAYEYDAANNLTKAGATTNTFNAADQLTEATTGVKYAYDEEGQRTSATPTSGPATTYGHDQAGDLTSVSRPAEGETPKIEDTYGYNGDGLRISQTISGTTTYDTLDHSTPIPMILNDGANSYIYVGELPVEQINSKEEVVFLHHDQQGSTRMLTNGSGTVQGAVTYEPYGSVGASTGSATTPLGYAAQYSDTDTGLIYMRARSYDPATAQFMSGDPIADLTREPYSYANDNPITYYDPTGFIFGIPGTPSTTEVVKVVSNVAGGVATVASGVTMACSVVAAPTVVGEAVCGVSGSVALGAGAVATGADTYLAASGSQSAGPAVFDTLGLGAGLGAEWFAGALADEELAAYARTYGALLSGAAYGDALFEDMFSCA